jgi:hypothetical protein
MEPSQAWSWLSTGAIICARFFPEQGDSLSHVTRLIDEFLVESLDDRILRAACELGASPSDLDFLLSRSVPDWRKVVTSAARGGHVHVFRWMAEREDTRGPWEADFVDAMNEAARYGHLEVIKWLLERGFRSVNGLALSQAIRYGHLAVVKWLLHVQEDGTLTDDEMVQLRYAAQNGHLATVQWMHKNVQGVDTTHAMSCAMAGAAESGDLDLLQRLHQLGPGSGASSSYVMDAAVSGGHFRVVEWLCENGSKGCSTLGTSKAAQAGNLPMLQWLHTHYSDRFDSGVMSVAAENGHLETVQWLHEHRGDGCSPCTIDSAVYKGNFNVVRWLHDNHVQRCTAHTMGQAARGGHLDIAKWLHENSSERCSESALFVAAYNGHLDVLRWLVEQYPDLCRDNLMQVAAWEGHLEVARYLDENTKQRASKWGLGAATRQGRLKARLTMMMNNHRHDEIMSRQELHAVGKEFEETFPQPSYQHVAPGSLLWAEPKATLELFHRGRLYSCVCEMLERALRRGCLAIAQGFIRHRSAIARSKYVQVAARRRNSVFLRWMLANGTPIDRSAAIQLAAACCFEEYVEVVAYLSEVDRVQIVRQAITEKKWCTLLHWTLKNTSFNEASSRAAVDNAIKHAPVQWLRENSSSTEARRWRVSIRKREKVL